jgi:hypothetical protein
MKVTIREWPNCCHTVISGCQVVYYQNKYLEKIRSSPKRSAQIQVGDVAAEAELYTLEEDRESSAKSRRNFGLFVFFDFRVSFLTTFVAFFWLYHPQM